jgi:uncharacterized protein YjiS (DUF1127 family)
LSNVTELFEALQAHLAQAQTRAERLGRLLEHDLDETGKPSLFARPLSRSMLSASLIRASDAAADIGIERNDTRWVALVTVLHAAGSNVGSMNASEAGQVATLLRLLQIQCVQLQFKRQTRGVSVLLA